MTTGRTADIPGLSHVFTMALFESELRKGAPGAEELLQALQAFRLALARDALAEAAARSGLPVEQLMSATLSLSPDQGKSLLQVAAAYERERNFEDRTRARAVVVNALADFVSASAHSVDHEAARRFFSGEEREPPAWADQERLLGNAVVICVAALASAGVAPLGALAAGILGAGAPVALAATVETAVTALTGGLIAMMITKGIERGAAPPRVAAPADGPARPIVTRGNAPAADPAPRGRHVGRSATPPLQKPVDGARPSPVSAAGTHQPPDPRSRASAGPRAPGGPAVGR